MEKTKIIKFNGTKVGVTLKQVTDNNIIVTTAINGEGAKLTYFKCRFCGEWTFNTDKMCKHCWEELSKFKNEKIEALNKLKATAQEEQKEETKTQKQKKFFIGSDIQPKIYVPKLENWNPKNLQPTKEQATILIQLIREGYNTREMLGNKLGLKPQSVQRYLTTLCKQNIVFEVIPKKNNWKPYYMIPGTTIKELD